MLVDIVSLQSQVNQYLQNDPIFMENPSDQLMFDALCNMVFEKLMIYPTSQDVSDKDYIH